VPNAKRYRKAFGTNPHHTGAYEDVIREIVTRTVATVAA